MELLKHITAEDIAKYGVVAAPDKLEGDPRANKMVFDRLVREMVAGAFNSAVDVINATMIATEEWGKEEAERVEAELARIAAENLRAAAETARATAETARVEAETIRETNERNRQSRETAREQAEESRADAESAREAAEQARKTQEASRAMEETARVNGEVVRQTNEQTRQNQESTRQTNEQTRQDKEAERQRQEATRQANEQTRQTAEQSRASGESARGANEKARAAAEELRKSAEASRATAENLRASAETNRASAENLRAAAETDRASAEAGRKTAETSRATAESKRETAETNRASAETAREKAEQSRASAETNRANAEDLRKAGEIDRINAENMRVDAEEARVAAEKIREEAYQSRKVVQETGDSTTAVMSQAAVTKELNQLSNEKVDQVPTGVKAEASGVVDKALSRDDTKVFRFLAVSDAHHKTDHELIAAGTKELGQGVGEVLKMIGVDFVANLGDICWGSSASDLGTVLQESKEFNHLVVGGLCGQTQIWTEGNHETDWLSESQIRALIYNHNTGLVYDADHWMEGYGYLDFPTQKVRVICLNTNQGPHGNVSGMSDEQVKWFAEVALNMEGKTDWNVITMGHHPLSYNTVSLMKYAAETVEAFINGENFSYTTNSGTVLSIDYRDKNCQYVAHFHGHAHAFSVVKMQKYVSSGVYEEIGAWEICIPNACYERNNQYKGVAYEGQYVQRYTTETTYSKTNVDGKRTSFNVITVCLDEKVIYADNFGAGIDRVITYAEKPLAKYSITRNLTNCMSTHDTVEIVAGKSHTEAFIPMDGFTMTGANVTVTMGGLDITASAYYYGVVNIAAVTGDVIITVVAVKEAGTPSYTNQIPISTDTDGSIYGGDYNGDGENDGYKTDAYLSGATVGTRAGVETTGFIPFDGSGNYVIYLSGITAKTTDGNFRLNLYNSSKELITHLTTTVMASNDYAPIAMTSGGDGNVTMLDCNAFVSAWQAKYGVNEQNTPAFFRLCAPEINGSSIITVNELIE